MDDDQIKKKIEIKYIFKPLFFKKFSFVVF